MLLCLCKQLLSFSVFIRAMRITVKENLFSFEVIVTEEIKNYRECLIIVFHVSEFVAVYRVKVSIA